MILLFLSVWAIVIALNEVLFANDPFAVSSLISSLPHTLFFTTILGSAVYFAKTTIIDAMNKGRKIDRRFMEELTPQVGEELNNMRKKLAQMDIENERQSKKKKSRKKDKENNAPVFPSDSELAQSKEQQESQYRQIYDSSKASVQAQERAAQRKANAKAAAKADAKAKAQDDILARLQSSTPEQGQGAANLQVHVSPEERQRIRAEAMAMMEQKNRERLAFNQGKVTAVAPHVDIATTPTTNVQISPEVRQAQLAEQRRKMKERREAKLAMLSAFTRPDVSQEMPEPKEQVKAPKAPKFARSNRNKALEHSSEPNKMASTRQQVVETLQRAKAQLQQTAEQSSQAHSVHDILHEHREHVTYHETTMPTGASMKDSSHSAASKDERNSRSSVELTGARGLNQGEVDTSALQKNIQPKQGAGLDTSGLKKVKLNNYNSHTANTSVRPMLGTSGRHTASISTVSGDKRRELSLARRNHVEAALLDPHYTRAEEHEKAEGLELSAYQDNVRQKALAQGQQAKASAHAKNSANANRMDSRRRASATTSAPAPSPRARAASSATTRATKSGPLGLGMIMEGQVGAQVNAELVSAPHTSAMPAMPATASMKGIQTRPVMRAARSSSIGRADIQSAQASVESRMHHASPSEQRTHNLDQLHAQQAKTYSTMQSRTTTKSRKDRER